MQEAARNLAKAHADDDLAGVLQALARIDQINARSSAQGGGSYSRPQVLSDAALVRRILPPSEKKKEEGALDRVQRRRELQNKVDSKVDEGELLVSSRA